jgi:very-short-patch-repair endonuclease
MKFRKDTPEKMKRLYRFLCYKYGPIDGEVLYKKYCRSSSKKMLIFKHGQEVGEKKYNEMIKNVSFSRTKDAYIKKYGEEEGTIRWKEKNSKLSVSERALKKNGYSDKEISNIRKIHANKSKHTLETYIERYGEEQGKIQYDEWINQKRVSVRSVNELVNRLGWSQEMATAYVKNIQSRGLEFFVEKYGLLEGTERYVTYNKKRLSYPNAVSRPQVELCKWLGDNLPNDVVEGIPLTEQPTIKFADGTWIFPDIVVNNKIVIEFNGEYWHSLPEVVEKDQIKAKKLKETGYILLTIWYNDYTNNKIQTQKKLLENINESKIN